jgi:hypothetical protein
MKMSGVKVIVVAIGQYVRQEELLAIASSPSLVFSVDSFDSLNQIAGSVITSACPSKAVSSCFVLK